VILTPTERTDSHAVKRVGAFWEALGGRLVILDPVTHDRATAAVSHLPHLVADALVDAVVRMGPRFFEVAGRGFMDTTRIAASDARVWREIFQENRAGLHEALGAFRAALDDLERLIDAGDVTAIEAALDRIRRVRENVV
jgi:prephenate dehydrogenase